MKVGDLVRYTIPGWSDWCGIVVKEIPGTDEIKVVTWTRRANGRHVMTANPRRDLEVISGSR